MRQRRRRREAVGRVDEDVDAVGDEHLERGPERGLRERVRVAADEQRPVDPVGPAGTGDGRASGDDVRLVEGRRERRAAVPGRAEGNALGGDSRIRPLVVVGGDQPIDVDEHRGVGRPAGEFVDRHPSRQLLSFVTQQCGQRRRTPQGSDVS